MQFLVVAFDDDDAHALTRRLAARKAHLANMTTLREHGHFIAGGAILDDDGQMIGSLSNQFCNALRALNCT